MDWIILQFLLKYMYYMKAIRYQWIKFVSGVLVTSAMVMGMSAKAQEVQVMSLEDCRRMALEANKGLKQADERVAETAELEKVMLWQMLPKVSANGGYMWMQRNPSLLSEEQKAEINSVGTTVQGDINQAIIDELGNLGVTDPNVSTAINNILQNTHLENSLNGMGQHITEALDLKMQNVTVGTVTVSQPLYMGGKLLSMYRTAALTKELAGVERDEKRDATLVAVEDAYWTVVSVKHKKELAEQYAELLRTLTANVEEMVEAEVATQGDLAMVRVKLNEAEMSLTKATNGLALAKMLLAQRCGMPLDTDFDVEEAKGLNIEESANLHEQTIDMEGVWSRRREMRKLRIGDSIAREGVRMAASTLKPNIMVTGGLLVSNPNIFDGFKNEFAGTLTAGVVVNVPIMHPGGIHSVKAAKHKRKEIEYQTAEAKEMIELQVNKVRYELELAYKKLVQSKSNMKHAEENLRLADESFKAGMCSSSDLMAAQTAWMKAQGEVIDAEIEIEMGRVYLKRAMGE